MVFSLSIAYSGLLTPVSTFFKKVHRKARVRETGPSCLFPSSQHWYKRGLLWGSTPEEGRYLVANTVGGTPISYDCFTRYVTSKLFISYHRSITKTKIEHVFICFIITTGLIND